MTRTPPKSAAPNSNPRFGGASKVPFPPAKRTWGPKKSQGPTKKEGALKAEPTRVLAWHKEKDLVCTHKDELGRETVYDRLRSTLPPHLKRIGWHAIGRLDADTTGLLLFTNDGELIHHATQPQFKLPKRYRALVKGLLTEAQLQALREGVELSGGLGKSGPAEVVLLSHQVATSWIELTIHEGKNRQVRRMLLAIGSQVIRLERFAFGEVVLDMELGQWRELSPEEIRQHLHYVPKT